MTFKAIFRRFQPIHKASAHCDIPCGIYDPIVAKIAAQTILKMTMRLQAATPPGANASQADRLAYGNTVARYIAVKEEHGTLCKKELDILWHDYFRPDHLQKYPDLHDKFWKAAKLASQCKQNVNLNAAQDLVRAVDDVAKVFWATKNVDYSDDVADARFGT